MRLKLANFYFLIGLLREQQINHQLPNKLQLRVLPIKLFNDRLLTQSNKLELRLYEANQLNFKLKTKICVLEKTLEADEIPKSESKTEVCSMRFI
jgi:hypothetical protein